MAYLDALQTTLAAEHAAVYLLGYLGGQTSSSAEPKLAAAIAASFTAHQERRDDVVQRVITAGGDPVGAEAAYDLPDLTTSAQVMRRALALERACATTYDFLVANAVGADRRWAVGLVVDAAVRGLAFGGEPETFPGR